VRLWRNLEHFLGAKENLPAIIGVIGAVIAAFIGAVIGGLMTGQSALRAQKQAAKDQRQRDLEIEERTIKGVLQAIAAELRSLKRANFDPLQQELIRRQNAQESLHEQGFVRIPEPVPIFRTEQNHFIVFDSNAAALGRINDEKLREDIITVYGNAKGLKDWLNTYAQDLERARAISNRDDRNNAHVMLAGLETRIRDVLDNLERGLDELVANIERYLDR
jgi:hypothetical protein